MRRKQNAVNSQKKACCPKSEIVYPVWDMPVYTQSRAVAFITYLHRYGC